MATEILSGIESNWVVTSLFLLILLPMFSLFNRDE